MASHNKIPLFRISRTTNRNEVQVSAVVDSITGTLVPPHITTHWIMYEVDATGKTVEEPTFLEKKMMLNIKNKQFDTFGNFSFALACAVDRPITIRNKANEWDAFVRLPESGRPGLLHRIHGTVSTFFSFVSNITFTATVPTGERVIETEKVYRVL